jgi:hypothetical protein
MTTTQWPPVQTDHDRSCDACDDTTCRCFCEECIALHPEREQLWRDKTDQEEQAS